MSDRLPPSSLPDGSGPKGPVTTVVRRTVKPDRRVDYEAWLRRLLADAESLPGYVGSEVHRPPDDAPRPVYTSVFRFETLEHRNAFEAGDLRRRYMAEVVDLVDGDAVWDTHTGLELWFSAPPGTVVPQPVRWRMALVLGFVVYVLVLVFGALASATMAGVPFAVRLAIVIAVEITLMTYVILPRVTRLLADWIYPARLTTG